ncbi:hypothetical protein BpHYR1_051702 [Brachionus plicatilis]|uniref:Uncharacterized protein n=1 Tax=Brachionus plicatilis TaxID=10195 RepID=A0A3M7SHA1_BRAPC|nr:hypothetical protein BpHYR1_051702 [Brachionus plicatilis]
MCRRSAIVSKLAETLSKYMVAALQWLVSGCLGHLELRRRCCTVGHCGRMAKLHRDPRVHWNTSIRRDCS